MPEHPETLLTIGEVAARVRHLARDPFAFTERARHWAKLGLLRATKQAGEGAGKHALFPESEAFVASVVNALAEAGLQPAGSRAVADAQNVSRHALAQWLRERAKGGKTKPLLMEIFFFAGGRTEIEVHHGARKASKPGPPTSIRVDLEQLFESVAEAAKGK